MDKQLPKNKNIAPSCMRVTFNLQSPEREASQT